MSVLRFVTTGAANHEVVEYIRKQVILSVKIRRSTFTFDSVLVPHKERAAVVAVLDFREYYKLFVGYENRMSSSLNQRIVDSLIRSLTSPRTKTLVGTLPTTAIFILEQLSGSYHLGSAVTSSDPCPAPPFVRPVEIYD